MDSLSSALRLFVCCFIAILALSSSGLADELVFKDRVRVSGTVLSATNDSVTIDAVTGPATFATVAVDTFRFVCSDVIQPKEGVPVQGKILRKVDERVYVATVDGVATWANSEIKKVWYGRGAAIDLPQFGQTGMAFSSREVTIGVPMLSHDRIYSVGVRMGLHIGLMSDWREQFIDENGNHPVASFLQFGPDGYVDLSRTVFVGGGVEYLLGRKIEVGDADDRPTAWLIFGTLGALFPLPNNPEFELGPAIDIGYLWGKEHVGIGGIGADGKAATAAIRPKMVLSVARERNWVLRSELGWLIATAKDVEIGGEPIEGYDLDFSGLSMIIGFHFIGPL